MIGFLQTRQRLTHFVILCIISKPLNGFFHVKTAGTSYLEAVKVAAHSDIDLFRRILMLSIETFHENAASYQISADVNNVPEPSGLDKESAVALIGKNPDVRQVLHIAFGVVLNRMGGELRALLNRNSELYNNFLVTHIGKHVALLTGE